MEPTSSSSSANQDIIKLRAQLDSVVVPPDLHSQATEMIDRL